MTNEMKLRVEGLDVVLERCFEAPRELVFRAFSEAVHLKEWWGPRGWECVVCHVDFRPGGVWHYCMKGVDESLGEMYGYEAWGKAVYREIVDGERIVYADYFSDAEGNESEELPESLVAMIFEDFQGGTRLICKTRYESEESIRTVLDMGMEQGIAETWDRLEEHLSVMQDEQL